MDDNFDEEAFEKRQAYLKRKREAMERHRNKWTKEERLARNLQSYQSIKSKDAADPSRKHRRNARRRELAAARRITLQLFADKFLEVNGITSLSSAKKIAAIYRVTVFHLDFLPGM
ncbi:unnamed protein product [Jaminaea pallidilutea]